MYFLLQNDGISSYENLRCSQRNKKGAIMFQTQATQAGVQSSFSSQKIYAFLKIIFKLNFILQETPMAVKPSNLLKCYKYKK